MATTMASYIPKAIKKVIYPGITKIAELLPYLKESEVKNVLPALLSIPVSLPLNLTSLPNKFASQFVAVKRIPPRRIFVLENVFISGQAVVFKNLKIFTPSLTWLRDIELYRNGHFLLQQWLTKPRYLSDETIALVYDDWSAANYYHWMIEALPRLLVVKQAYPDCTIIVPEPSPEYIQKTIQLLGFRKLLSLHRHSGHILKASRLIFPELVYYYEEEYANLTSYKSQDQTDKTTRPPQLAESSKSQELIVSVRNLLVKHFDTPPTEPQRKVFVSRSRQKTRTLQNEAETRQVLEMYGFETVYFEDLAFEDQVNLMLDTKIVISVHGANMVNILFMRPGTTVIECMNEEHLNDAYYLLSSALELDYYSVPCKMADRTIKLTDDSVILNDADLVVNISYLRQTLDSINKDSIY